MWRGERSSWRCTNDGGCRDITSIHRGITRVHRGITKVHSGAARRRIINPIHAALEKGLGDIPRHRKFGSTFPLPSNMVRRKLLHLTKDWGITHLHSVLLSVVTEDFASTESSLFRTQLAHKTEAAFAIVDKVHTAVRHWHA